MLINVKNVLFFLSIVLIGIKAAAQNPINLKTENSQNPKGLTEFKPKFSWKVKVVTKNTKQTAYQLIVASTEANLKKNVGDIWDTKKVNNAISENIVFGGKPLEPTKKYYWKVKIWNEKAKPSVWSEAAFFEMGILKKTDWTAKWIGKLGSEGKPSKALDFQKEFKLEKRATKVKIFVTGLGAYYLTLNGKKVGNDFMAAGMQNYSDTLLYQTYEIDPEILSVGTNFISASVGNGWFGSGLAAIPGSMMSEGSNRLFFQMELSFYDGSIQAIVSDANWQVRNSAILASSVYTGENHDGKLEYSKDWNNADILDEISNKITVFGQQNAVAKTFDYSTKNKVLLPSQSEPIQVVQELKALSVKEPKKGHFVFDFGQNLVGFIQLTVEGKEGKDVEIVFSDLLDKKGLVDQSKLKIKQKDIYSLKGYSKEVWEPKFTYHTFRYAEITGYTGKADINSLISKVLVNYPGIK